jgi:hypothetical protein
MRLWLLVSSALVLAACGRDPTRPSDSTKNLAGA